MALDERYILASDLLQFFNDKDSGLPLSAGTLTFYKDSARNTPKAVYQLSGSPPDYTYTSLGAQITLNASGCVQNSGGDSVVIYYFPYDSQGNVENYYVVCKNEEEVEQFTREAWPNITSGNNPVADQFPVQNQISNPQFTHVSINEDVSTTYTVSGATDSVFELGPNWEFVISGTGTVVVQRIPISGNDNIQTNPPYVLDINASSGITECLLRQRFFTNSGLWSSTDDLSIFLAGTMMASNQNSGTTGIQMYYLESSGGTPVNIIDASFDNTGYSVLTGSTTDPIPQSNNTDSGSDGYIDIYLMIQASSHIRISSIQVVPTIGESVDIVSYDQNSSNREEALQGDYYLPRAASKQINSFLIAWDFTVNPFQVADSGNIATTAAYIADQTIALRGSSGNITFQRDTITNGMLFTTAGTNDAFYIMQYLPSSYISDMTGSRLSVNVFGYQDSSSDPVTMRVYLFRGSSTAVFPTLPTSIGTVATDGQFTLTASEWTAYARSGLSIPQTTLNQISTSSDINSDKNDYGFSGWEMIDADEIDDTDKFAIVVTFSYPDASTEITINSISVVPGDLPCRPGVKSAIETLQDAQGFYEQSYLAGVVPGTNTNDGVRFFVNPIAPNTQALYKASFDLRFMTSKWTMPTVTLYSPNGSINNVQMGVFDGSGYPSPSAGTNPTNIASSNWTVINADLVSVYYRPANATDAIDFVTTGQSRQGEIQLQYVSDARPGII